MHFANLCGRPTCCCFVHYLIENLRHCSFAEAGIVLNLFLNFERKASCSYKKRYTLKNSRLRFQPNVTKMEPQTHFIPRYT